MLHIVLIVGLLASPAFSHSSGAPRSSCNNGLMPSHHHIQPKKTAAPYSFSGEDVVKSGNEIKLSLTGNKFLGFMLQAQDEEQKPLGTFKVIEKTKSQLLRCSVEGDTLTHVNLHKKPITSVIFVWQAPEDYKGAVKFVATVAKDHSTFWVGKISKEVIVV